MTSRKALKKKGKELLKEGYGLIDTSGRVKEINERSVLAIVSKDVRCSVLLEATEKKKIFPKIEKLHPPKRRPAIIHAVKIYFAIKDNIASIPGVYVCGEGTNRGLLKHYLKQLLGNDIFEEKIVIIASLRDMFGKKNIADKYAGKVRSKKKGI